MPCWLPQHWAHLIVCSQLPESVLQVVPQVVPQFVPQVSPCAQIVQEAAQSHLSELGHAHVTQQMVAEGWQWGPALLLRFVD